MEMCIRDSYTINGREIPYHLIDIVEPGYKYNVFEYQRDFLKAYETIKPVSYTHLKILK